jgi:hypothetical protein
VIEFDGRVTARSAAARALRSLRGAFFAMPFLFLLTLVLGAGLGAVMHGVAPLRDALAAPKFEDFSVTVIVRHLGAYFAGIAIWSVIVAPLAVAIHRFILLDEKRAGFPYARAATCNFLYWLAGLLLAVMAARAFCLLLGAVSFVRTLSEFAVNAGALIVGLQIALIFPGIAIGVPAASMEKRLDTGFRMAEGKFLLLLRTYLLTQLPLLVLRAGLLKFAAGPAPKVVRGEPPPLPPDPTVLQLAAAGAAGAVSILAIALLAATLSWLYAARRKEI